MLVLGYGVGWWWLLNVTWSATDIPLYDLLVMYCCCCCHSRLLCVVLRLLLFAACTVKCVAAMGVILLSFYAIFLNRTKGVKSFAKHVYLCQMLYVLYMCVCQCVCCVVFCIGEFSLKCEHQLLAVNLRHTQTHAANERGKSITPAKVKDSFI